MKIKALVCRMDGTQELTEYEVPDDWAAPDAEAADVTPAKTEKGE